MADYVFEGEIIKLNAKDYYKWADMYKSLDLTAELIQMDEEFQIRLREGEKLKKWFSETYARLNARNKHAAKSKSYCKPALPDGIRNTRDIPWQEELTDRRWCDDEPLKLTN